MIAVKDTTAASMLDMSAPEFRRLVDAGVLPPPCRIGKHERWRVDTIKAVVNGDASWPDDEDIEA
ncbi:hypothetical protein [Roseovarius sp. MMSF_3281]|uniref:hypothetical protein n=1 Tax=Roseovarius sp. MMSF_3281 TaxID=3046694 RepID=UPI00273E8FD4|nr:hypothetical protein [Roseovarius sp. MMSF_3281]